MKKEEIEQYADLFVEFWEDIVDYIEEKDFNEVSASTVNLVKIILITQKDKYNVFGKMKDTCLFCEVFARDYCNNCPINDSKCGSCFSGYSSFQSGDVKAILEVIKKWRDEVKK